MKLFRKLLFVALSAVIALSVFGACELGGDTVIGDPIEVSVEVGATVNLTEYFRESDHLANIKLNNPSGEKVDFGNGQVVLSRCGNYTLILSDGCAVKFVVTDSVGPVISFTGIKDVFYVGEEILLPLSAMDAGDGAVEVSSVKVFLGENEIALSGGKFTPTERGQYKLVCEAIDSKGNRTRRDYILNVMNNTPYGNFSASLTNLTIEGATRVGKDYVDDGEYAYLVNSLTEQGWTGVAFSGKGLTPYSKYTLTVGVSADSVTGDFAFAVYPTYISPKADMGVVSAGDCSLQFEVCTDGNGDFSVSYFAWSAGASQVVWKSISAVLEETYTESVESCEFNDIVLDGVRHTFAIKAGATSPDFKNIANSDGFTTIDFGGYGYATMEISGSGLEAEKQYTFTLKYSANNVSDANFAFIVYSNSGFETTEMLGWKSRSTVDYTVMTDENGCYHVTFNNFALLSNGIQLSWEGIYGAVEYKGSIYGDGITFVNGNASSAGMERWTTGDNKGYSRWKAYFDGSKSGVLEISASAEAGLTANTQYEVKVTAISDIDVGYIVYASDYAEQQVVGSSAGTLTFRVTTDANGCFTISLSTYHNGCTWVDFTGMEIVEVQA